MTHGDGDGVGWGMCYCSMGGIYEQRKKVATCCNTWLWRNKYPNDVYSSRLGDYIRIGKRSYIRVPKLNAARRWVIKHAWVCHVASRINNRFHQERWNEQLYNTLQVIIIHYPWLRLSTLIKKCNDIRAQASCPALSVHPWASVVAFALLPLRP